MSFGPLVSSESLKSITTPVRLLDARPGAEVYARGHLEGALQAEPDLHLSTASEPGFDPAKGGRHPLPSPARWAAQLGEWGIGPETAVVVYDDSSGGNAACRLWWMLRAFGHTRVAVLDGGLSAALSAGLATTLAKPDSVPALPDYPCSAWQRSTMSLEEVERQARDPAWKVLDVRSRERWRGDSEPFDPTPGRIPGSINLPLFENLSPDGRYKPATALQEMYLGLLDGTPPERLVVHCGSGVTACHTLLALEMAGLDGAALYVGSYSEWCRSGRPIGRR